VITEKDDEYDQSEEHKEGGGDTHDLRFNEFNI
jgi:hypothetical protein